MPLLEHAGHEPKKIQGNRAERLKLEAPGNFKHKPENEIVDCLEKFLSSNVTNETV
jgi:hypothetical protein